MPCIEEPTLSDEIQEQLFLLENSQCLIRSILLGVAMQYQALDLQKYLLLQEARKPQGSKIAGCPDPKSIQVASSLIVLNALFGFQKQAEDIASQTAQAGGCPDWMESKLNATVILVALLRLCRLVSPGNAPASGGAASAEDQNLEEQGALEEPIV